MTPKPKLDQERIQKIVTDRATIREELTNQIIAELENIEASVSNEMFRRQAIARIKAIAGVGTND